MTTTTFFSPSLITQVNVPNEITGIPSIDWNFNPNVIADSSEAVTKAGLYTMSGLWMEKFLSNTSQLWCTGYNIPNTSSSPSGVNLTSETGLFSTRYRQVSNIIMTEAQVITLFGPDYIYFSGRGPGGATYYQPSTGTIYLAGGNTLIVPVTITDANNTVYHSTAYAYAHSVGGLNDTPGTPGGPFAVTIQVVESTPMVFPITLTTDNYTPAVTKTLVGIEFQLNIQRAARIEDLLIQLTLNGELIGDNYASMINPVQSDMYTGDNTVPTPVGDSHIYGGPTDLWATTDLAAADISDPTFGIVVSFRSNAIYPHRDLAYLSQVALRITYA